MSSIDAGKQQVTFDWYRSTGNEQVKEVITTPPTISSVPTTSASSYNIHAADILTFINDRSRSLQSDSVPVTSSSPIAPLPEIPSSNSLLEPAYIQEFVPNVDTVELDRSFKEPSRIRRPPVSFSSPAPHLASKHPHPIEEPSTQQFGELPLKRVRVDERDHDGESWDYNTFPGSDVIDFQFARGAPSDLIALEEAERKERMSRRANPVLVGRFRAIQKEFMSRVNRPSFTPVAASFAPVAAALSDSLINLKDVIIEKGHNLIESSKDAISAINPHPLRDTLNAIADAKYVEFRPLSLGGDRIEFIWPRVPAYIKDAEELARSERSHGVSPVLFGKWKMINNELKSKWTTGLNIAPKKSLINSASALVGKASIAIDEAVHYTTGMMENLGLKSQEPAYDLEWITVQQEKERARRINETLLSPGFDSRKARMENQLLRSVHAIKPSSGL